MADLQVLSGEIRKARLRVRRAPRMAAARSAVQLEESALVLLVQLAQLVSELAHLQGEDWQEAPWENS